MKLAKSCLERAIESLRRAEQFAATNEKAKEIETIRVELEMPTGGTTTLLAKP